MAQASITAPDYFNRYISLVDEDNLNKAIRKNSKKFRQLLKAIPEKKSGYAYADGKWTLKQLLQHIIDAERIFTYRALWFARQDEQPLSGFDENAWASHADASGREWKEMIDEFRAVRKSTEYLFTSFSDDELRGSGLSGGNLINVTALGYVCVGHVDHHMRIIRERYL